MVNNEVKNLIERLRDWDNTSYGRNRKDMIKAADLLEQLQERLATIYSQPAGLPEPELTDIEIEKADADGICPVVSYYTSDQLTKAVQEATARALEAAAKECDARYMGDNNREDMEARRCADAIRNLIGNVPLRGVK